MGGCCCSSRMRQFHGTPVYYYYPQSEEHESLTSYDDVANILSSRVLIDPDLNMSIPDTYRSPPMPIPYDVVLGRPHSTGPGGMEKLDLKDENCINQSRKVGHAKATNEEDVCYCSTCLEEYDAENPKITTKCNHHFHLSCILEWMERSDTCPICDQEMIYEAL